MSTIPSTETLGTCPECGALVALTVCLQPDHVEYSGNCKDHGSFTRTESRLDMADLGTPINSTVGIHGQKKSA